MKKTFYSIVFLFSFFLADSQVVVKLQLPPAGITLKSQLWNLSLVNTSQEMLRVSIDMVVTDVVTNQTLISGASKILNLPKGLLQVTPNKVVPVTYYGYTNVYNISTAQEGFLPVGTYNVCYLISSYRGDAIERLAEECTTIDVDPISPPILVSPQDRDNVELPRPVFNWLPPSPITLFAHLAYDFTLVEVQQQQTEEDAIQKNIPIQFQGRLKSATTQYALSLPALDSNKIYAWQVTATNNGVPVAKSEVWTFNLKRSEKYPAVATPADYFARLSKTPNESFVITGNTIKYSYINEANDKTAAIKIYDITNATRKELHIDSTETSLRFGENFNALDLSGNLLSDKRFYMLELINSKEEHWFLKFQYRKSN